MKEQTEPSTTPNYYGKPSKMKSKRLPNMKTRKHTTK